MMSSSCSSSAHQNGFLLLLLLLLWGALVDVTTTRGLYDPGESLSFTGAKFLLDAVRVQAAQMNMPPLAVVIVDGNGEVIVSTAIDGVPPGIGAIVEGKALAAATFGAQSGSLRPVDGSSGLHSAKTPGNMVLLDGGVPLVVAGTGRVIGAVACGGSPTPEQDLLVCQAAADIFHNAMSPDLPVPTPSVVDSHATQSSTTTTAAKFLVSAVAGAVIPGVV